uniref:PH-15 domain-containing protein n=1 Tax=Parascaris univalens TaxID=6257 RepID=A0A915B4M0_PARUN
MRLFGRHGNYTSLPDQQELFALPEALCGYIEKRSLTPLGWRWRRRAVLLNRSGHLIVYKNFLEGVGAVKPFIGHVYHVDASQFLKVTKRNNITFIKIIDNNNAKVELRIKGENGTIWAAKVFMYRGNFNKDYFNSLPWDSEDINWPVENTRLPLNEVDSKISKSSIIDESKKNHLTISQNASSESCDIEWSTTSSGSSNSLSESKPSLCHQNKTQTTLSTAVAVDLYEAPRQTHPNTTSACVSHATSSIRSSGDDNISDDGIANSEISHSTKRTRSMVHLTTNFATTSQEVIRSRSADDMCKIPSARQRRFRQLLQTMIESGMYSAVDCDNIDVSCSEAVLHNMSTFTQRINTTLTNVPYTEDVYKPSLSRGDLSEIRKQPTINEASLSHANEIDKPLNGASSHSSIAIIHL